MLRSFLQAVLEAEGFSVVEAETGAEMFSALERSNFDVIILDIMLPDGNGVDFARTLRRSSNLPIIFATAVTDTDTRRRAIGLMQVDYVTKPFDAKELLLRIENIRSMAPVMEDPNARNLPRPPSEDATAWYRGPLIWGPALAFAIIFLGGIFLIPGEQDPADLQAEKVAAVQRATPQSPGSASVQNSASEEQSGVVVKDAAPVQQTGGAGNAASQSSPATSTGTAGSTPEETTPEQKIIEACGELPVSEFWNNNSVKRILRYVRFVHNGNWGEYLKTWVDRLRNVQELEAAGKPVELAKKDIVLSGEDLTKYIDLMERRVRYIRCASQISQTLN